MYLGVFVSFSPDLPNWSNIHPEYGLWCHCDFIWLYWWIQHILSHSLVLLHSSSHYPKIAWKLHFSFSLFPKAAVKDADLDLPLDGGFVEACPCSYSGLGSLWDVCPAPLAMHLCLSLSPENHLYSASSLMSAAQASTCFVRNELPLIKNQQKWACNTLCPINILTSSSSN